MTPVKIMIYGLLFYLPLLWGTAALFIKEEYVDFWSVTAVSFQAGLLIALLQVTQRNARSLLPFVFFFVGYSAIYFLLRFWSVLIDPEYFLWKELSSTPGEMFLTTSYILAGTLASGVAIMLASRKASAAGDNTHKKSYGAFSFPSTGFLAIGMLLFAVMAVGKAYSDTTLFPALNLAEKFFYSFFSLEGFMALVGYVAIRNWESSDRLEKLWFWIAVVIYVIARLLLASKGGIFVAAVVCGAFWFLVFGQKRIAARYLIRMAIMVPVILFLISLSFDIGKMVRFARHEAHIANAEELVEYGSSFEEYSVGESRTLPALFSRFNGIDSVLAIIRKDNPAHEFSVLDDLAAIVNSLVPGTVFDNVHLSSQYYSVAFLDVPLRLYEGGLYSTYSYTLYGNALAYFGPVGGLLAICLVIFVVARIYLALGALPVDPVFSRGVWLYLVHYVVISFGFDFFTIIAFQFLLNIGAVVLAWKLWKLSNAFIRMASRIPG